ncbi:hypothetical protein [Paraburkholderia aspalathi]|uniref:hypothetical protein n=1 Tax=Paraburkholderia aspalathi TaxID=1324617 RepID=UPI0038B79532
MDSLLLKITGVTITRPYFLQTHGAVADQELSEMKIATWSAPTHVVHANAERRRRPLL